MDLIRYNIASVLEIPDDKITIKNLMPEEA